MGFDFRIDFVPQGITLRRAEPEARGEYWIVGSLATFVVKIKAKMDNILIKNHYSIIPLFHYSMNKAKT
jgi:hypothetical protein